MRRIAGRVPIRAERAEAFIVNTRNGERDGQQPTACAASTSRHGPSPAKARRCGRGAGTDRARERLPAQRRGRRASRCGRSAPRSGGHFALATAFLTKYRADNAGSAADAPFPTITANGDSDRPGGNPPLALVAAHLEQANGGNYEGTGARWMRRCRRCSEPARSSGGHNASGSVRPEREGHRGPDECRSRRYSPARRDTPRSALF